VIPPQYELKIRSIKIFFSKILDEKIIYFMVVENGNSILSQFMDKWKLLW
jgi:hypothetical protein